MANPSIPEMKLALSEHGMYSPLEKAALAIPRTKGTPAEFMAEASKQPGFRKEEVEDRAVSLPQQKMTKPEFMGHLQKHAAPKITKHVLKSYDSDEEAEQAGAKKLYNEDYEELDRDERYHVGQWLDKNQAQYKDYAMPGGENYREVLLQSPYFDDKKKELLEARKSQHRRSTPGMQELIQKDIDQLEAEKASHGPEYKSSHYSHPNILAHMRLSDREGPDGEKLLHLDELQSDWHQAGRKKGYKINLSDQEKERLSQIVNTPNWTSDEQMLADFKNLSEKTKAAERGVPNAPFKKNWHEMALKHALHEAAKGGYHGLVITPGQEQADRYDLSKQVGQVHYEPNTNILVAFDPEGKVMSSNRVKPADLDEHIGKDAAEKLLAAEPSNGVHVIEGDDLKVGGEGMKGFYDKIIPDYLNKLGKKHGVKVGQHHAPESKTPLHHFPINDSMREQILKEGLPMYKEGGDVHKAKGDTVKAKKPSVEEMKQALTQNRAPAKSKESIQKIAERVAPQVLGEFVRKEKGTTSVADKSRKQFDREKLMQHDIRPTKELPPVPEFNLEQHRDKVMIPVPGDRTVSDQILHSVDGQELTSPSPQYGGPRYGHGKKDFWASGISPARGVVNLAKEASEHHGGKDVLGNYMAMSHEGSNYAQHLTDALLSTIDPSKMPAEKIKSFNKLLREGNNAVGSFPDVPGIEDPAGLYLHTSFNSDLRKHFNGLMMQPTVTKEHGLINGQDVLHAITEPKLGNLETGVTGFSVGQLPTHAPELQLSSHPTYSHDIPGKFLGATKHPVPYELMYPDTVNKILSNPRQANNLFGTLKMGRSHQIIDNQLIDEINQYQDAMKKLTGYAEGGNVNTPSMAQMKMALQNKGNSIDTKNIGVNEAPNMAPKKFFPPDSSDIGMPSPGGVATPSGMPIGGVDADQVQPGQQLMQAPQGQPPMAPPQGTPQNPGAPAGAGPTPPMGNMLQMTPQGQTMAALGGAQPPAPPQGLAEGGQPEKVYTHRVIDPKNNNAVMGKYTSLKSAIKARDRLDNQYGAYRYKHEAIPETPALKDGGQPEKIYTHRVVDPKNGNAVMGKYTSLIAASKAKDRLDNQYGGYRYRHEPIPETLAQGGKVKKGVVVHKGTDTMRYEMTMKKKAK